MSDKISKALDAIKSTRTGPGAWVDSEGGGRVGLIKTAESLCALFSPIVRSQDGTPIVEVGAPLDSSLLIEDLDSIVDTVSRHGWGPSPYLDHDLIPARYVEYQAGLTDFIDAVSFVIRVLLEGITYHRLCFGDLPEETLRRYQGAVRQAIEWLMEEAVDFKDGAFWIGGKKFAKLPDNFEKHSLYFDYSACVALQAALDHPDSEAVIPDRVRCIELLEKCGNWIVGLIDEYPYAEGYLRIDPEFTRASSVEARAEIVYALAILQAGSKFYSVDAARVLACSESLMKLWSEDRVKIEQGGDHDIYFHDYPTDKLSYSDSSLIYLLLQVLSWSYWFEKSRNIESRQILTTANLVRNEILDLWDPETKLWRMGAFYTYYTQRAIESLVSWRLYSGLQIEESKGSRMDVRPEVLAEIIAESLRAVADDFAPRVLDEVIKRLDRMKSTRDAQIKSVRQEAIQKVAQGDPKKHVGRSGT